MPGKPRHEHDKPELAGVEALYSDNVKTHRLNPKSVGWKDEAAQQLRFQQLVRVIRPESADRSITVNDYGCGYGAMFRYLDNMASVKLARYYGYDISKEMLTAAQEFVNDTKAEFFHSSHVIKEADYSFASGTFHVKLDASHENWTEFVKETVIGLAEKSKWGCAFNLLSEYVDWKQENLYYADPMVFFDFCKRDISRYVSLLHDYPLYEWTIIIHKENSPIEMD